MQHKSLADLPCPIARGLEHVGEWWSILILRDALRGHTRFDEFQKSLPIAPNMLTRRLAALVESGLLARQQYSTKPPRFEYTLTEAGLDFQPVIAAIFAWGQKHYGPSAPRSQFVHRTTGEIAEPIVMDQKSGLPLASINFAFKRIAPADVPATDVTS
ncbi:MAG: helix-turn-helix domain-containing protein [Gemmatimonadaceae bacterium]